MRITRMVLAALLTLGATTVGQATASAESVAPVSAPADFWFICC